MSANDGGGEVARAAWPDGTTWHASLGTLKLHVVLRDSLPAAGTVVALEGTEYWAVADSNGNLHIGDLVPGPYSVLVVEPRLAELGLTMPTPLKFVAVRDSTTEAMLGVESLEQFTFGRCFPGKKRPAPDGAYLLGRVVTQGGLPVDRANVTIAIAGRDPFYRFTTGTDGVFPLCLGTSDRTATLTIKAEHNAEPAVAISPTLADHVTLVRVVLH